MVMQALPTAALEVVEAEFLLHLLMLLLADPARLDPGSQDRQGRLGGQITEIILVLAIGAPLANEPEFRTRQRRAIALGGPQGQRTIGL